DRNRIALQADVLGAAALGLPNFVFMSGDDPKQGNHPDAVNVKDLDGIGLVRMAVGMRDGKFLSGDEIRNPPAYLVGATASPFAKVPGIALGPDVVERMKKAPDGEAEGIAIAVEMVRSLKALPGVRGVHLYAIEWPEAVPLVVEKAGLLPRPEAKVAVS